MDGDENVACFWRDIACEQAVDPHGHSDSYAHLLRDSKSLAKRTNTALNCLREIAGFDVRPLISPPIGEALPFNALHGFDGARVVVDPKRNAV